MSILDPTNSMSILLRDRKDIFRTTSMLMSANKKISSKNLICSSLSTTEKPVVIILFVFKGKPSIFWAPTLIGLAVRLNLAAWGWSHCIDLAAEVDQDSDLFLLILELDRITNARDTL